MKINGKTVLIGIGVGLLLWYLVKQSGRVDIGTASISRLKLDGANLVINVKLPVLNRTDFPVPITGFIGSLLYDGAQIGTTSLAAQTTLQGRSQAFPEFTTKVSLLSVALSTPLLSLLNTLANKYLNLSLPGVPSDAMLDTSTLPNALKALRIRGTLYVGPLGIDIDEPLTV